MSDKTETPESTPDRDLSAESAALEPTSGAATNSDDFGRDGVQRVLFYSILGGLCPLIPIPFIDDLLLGYVRRHMIESQLKKAKLSPMIRHIDALSKEDKLGCVQGCLTFAVIYPIKKIFRKIAYFLAVKDCVDVTSSLLHEGWLLNYVLEQRFVTEETLTSKDDLKQLGLVRQAILAACASVDTRPINKLLSGMYASSKGQVMQTARSLGGVLKREGAKRRKPDAVEHALESIEGEDAGKLGTLTDKLGRTLSGHQVYLRELEQAFEQHFDRLKAESEL